MNNNYNGLSDKDLLEKCKKNVPITKEDIGDYSKLNVKNNNSDIIYIT